MRRQPRPWSTPSMLSPSLRSGAMAAPLPRMDNSSDLMMLMIERHIRPETYAAATAALVDAQHAQPFAAIWGDGRASSSDGQFFRSDDADDRTPYPARDLCGGNRGTGRRPACSALRCDLGRWPRLFLGWTILQI